MQGLGKGPADGHGLPHRLHGGGEQVLGPGKFLECPSRDLDHAVVDGGFKRGTGLPGDVIGDLVQGISHGQFGRDLGNGKAGGLGRQGRTPGHPRVHLNDHHLSSFRVDGELDIGAPGLHPDLPDDPDGRIAHHLIFPVRKGLGRGHGDAVPGVHTHGINIFNGADDHHIVLEIPHDLQFVFLPSQEGFLHDDLGDHAGLQAGPCQVLHLFPVVGHAAAHAAQGETGPDNEGVSDPVRHLPGLIHVPGDPVFRDPETDAGHGIPELLPVLGLQDDR